MGMAARAVRNCRHLGSSLLEMRLSDLSVPPSAFLLSVYLLSVVRLYGRAGGPIRLKDRGLDSPAVEENGVLNRCSPGLKMLIQDASSV